MPKMNDPQQAAEATIISSNLPDKEGSTDDTLIQAIRNAGDPHSDTSDSISSDSGSEDSISSGVTVTPPKETTAPQPVEGSVAISAPAQEEAEAARRDAATQEKYLGNCAQDSSKASRESYQPGSAMAYPIKQCMAPFIAHFGPEMGKKVATLAILDVTQGGIVDKDDVEQKEITSKLNGLPFILKDFMHEKLAQKYSDVDSLISPNAGKTDTKTNGFQAENKFSTTFYNDYTYITFDSKTFDKKKSHICRLVTTSNYEVLEEKRVSRSYKLKIEWPDTSPFTKHEQTELLAVYKVN